MPTSVADDLTPKTKGLDASPFKAFLRERWGGLLVSALVGYLVGEYLNAVDWAPWAQTWLHPIWSVRRFTQFTWIPLAGVLFALGILFDWVFERMTENNYKSLLIGRYLRRRRIAWVSLIAVMLCTYMVLVVISVMGGWLNMFKKSFRGLSGDIVIESRDLHGFPFYEQIIDAIKKDPQCEVSAAIPSIETGGLINFGKYQGPTFARVMGIPIDEVETVNKFDESLFLQHKEIEEQLKNPNLTAEVRARLERKLHEPPSFNLLNDVTTPLSSLPPELRYVRLGEADVPRGKIAMPASFPAELKGRLRYDATRHNLIFNGKMQPQWHGLIEMGAPFTFLDAVGRSIGLKWKVLLQSLSPDPEYKNAIDVLYRDSQHSFFYKGFTGQFNGLIVGNAVINIRRDSDWNWIRPDWEFHNPTTLTLLDLSSERVNQDSIVTKNYYIVDDSHLGVWQYDQNYVYVAFDQLQKDLNMAARAETIDGVDVIEPARVTNIHVRVHPDIDPNDEARLRKIQARIEVVLRTTMQNALFSDPTIGRGQPIYAPEVHTWQDMQRVWISAIENEKLMLVILFGIISVVAVFLIFCIFYMIVAEKTKDIGIIKSVGATSVGVAMIFVGYGLVIGVVGSGVGLLMSYLTLHNINELHRLLGQILGLQIWDPQVYVFDKIPDEMSGTDVAVIVPVAIFASVLGALVPAFRAGRMNPVEALRWE